MIALMQALITTSFTVIGVDIADVLKFAGAGGGLVCSFGLPALIHGRAHWRQGTLTCVRAVVVATICAFGVFCFTMQLVPSGSGGDTNSSTANSTV